MIGATRNLACDVVFCDPEHHVLRAVEYKFRPAGYSARCATNGQRAWTLLKHRRPDALITDVRLPDMDGMDFVRQIRADEELADLPILLLTDKGFELPLETVWEELDVVAVIPKPFSPREVLLIVNELLTFGRRPDADALLRNSPL